MIQAGRSSAQAISRARILLKIDEGQTAPHVVAALDVSERTVFRVKRRHVEEGLDEVLRHHNSLNKYRKAAATKDWRFTAKDVRTKLCRLYPCYS